MFEGALARCFPRITPAPLAFSSTFMKVLHPVFMFVMVCRTIWLRVHPDTLLVIKPKMEDKNAEDGSDGKRSFLAKVETGWKEDDSLFAWADKGSWETIEAEDQTTRRKANWFRIGFEPLFVDFTKTGSWFMAFSLVEVRAIV